MKKTYHSQKGFGAFFLLILIALLSIAGVVGFVVLKKPAGYDRMNTVPMMTDYDKNDAPQATLSPSTDTDTIESELESTTVNSVDSDFNEMNDSASSL
jgi:hypothetical protein